MKNEVAQSITFLRHKGSPVEHEVTVTITPQNSRLIRGVMWGGYDRGINEQPNGELYVKSSQLYGGEEIKFEEITKPQLQEALLEKFIAEEQVKNNRILAELKQAQKHTQAQKRSALNESVKNAKIILKGIKGEKLK